MNYVALLHSHSLFVVLFLLIYVIKAALLLGNKKETLQKFTKIFKIPEIIISVGFLVTGVLLYLDVGNKTMILHAKILLVFASIPLAIIGFKKMKKPLAVLAVLFIIVAYGLGEVHKRSKVQATQNLAFEDLKKAGSFPYGIEAADFEDKEALQNGIVLYNNYCVSCHGEDGQAMRAGAANLLTACTKEGGIRHTILNGQGRMAGFGGAEGKDDGMIKEEEARQIAKYVIFMQAKAREQEKANKNKPSL